MSLSNHAENNLLDHILGTAAYTAPTPYLALFTSPTDDAGGGDELAAASYGRVTFTARAASSGEASNDAEIEFPRAAEDWGQITHAAVFDAETDGNMLWHGPLNKPVSILANEKLVVDIGQLACSIS